MKFIKKYFLMVIVGCSLLLALSACYTSTNGQNTSSSSNSYGNGTTSGNGTAASTTVATGNTFGVKVAQVNVKGKTEAVLTDDAGMTLYTFLPDTATKTACTGPCAVTWPPHLAKQVGQTSDGTIGSISAVQDANGIQVQAKGRFLYTFSKDSAPGQANGEGVAGKWFVAVPSN